MTINCQWPILIKEKFIESWEIGKQQFIILNKPLNLIPNIMKPLTIWELPISPNKIMLKPKIVSTKR